MNTEPKKFSPSATYYDCGICGHWHAIEWNGDCREDASRFTTDELDEQHFAEAWAETEMPD